jgi:tRNA(adenine34) deaminase
MQDNDLDIQGMKAALEQSHISIRQGNGETGCVIMKDGIIVAVGHNEENTRIDPTAHAEMVTIQKLCKDIGTKDLTGYTLYSTLQPCAMCSVACIWAGVSRIVYGAGRGTVHDNLFAEKHLNVTDFVRDSFHPDIEIIGGVLEQECSQLYQTK